MKFNSSALSNFLFFLLFVYLSVSVPLHPVLSSSPSSIPVPLIHFLSPSVRPCLSLPHKSHVTMSGCQSGFTHSGSLCQRTWHSRQAQSHWAGFYEPSLIDVPLSSHITTLVHHSLTITVSLNRVRKCVILLMQLQDVYAQKTHTYKHVFVCNRVRERAENVHLSCNTCPMQAYPHPIWHWNRTGQKLDSSYTTYTSVEIQYLDT